MSKKHKKHEEHANHERWLVSYADFITLLFAFFVVMFSASQVDRSKTNKLALAVEAAFSTFSIFKDAGGQMNLVANPSKVSTSSASLTSQVAEEEGDPIFMPPQVYQTDETVIDTSKGDASLSENAGVPTPEEEALGRVQRDLMEVIDRKKLRGSVLVNQDDRGIIISIREAGIFESGADKMTPASYEMLEGVGHILTTMPNQIRVEGHSDNTRVTGRFPTNWELSAARATSVLRWLVDHYHIDPSRFSAMGYGEYRPIADNATPDGRLRNRRVDIVILSDEAAKKEAPVPKHRLRQRAAIRDLSP